jgi:signal peptide peptidase SppA
VSNHAYANVMARVVNTPLMAHPRKALVYYNALCGRFGTAPADLTPAADPVTRAVDNLRAKPGASRFVGKRATSEGGRPEPYMIDGRTGIVTITGTLINRGAWVGSDSGETSYEGIKFQLARIGRDPRVQNVILDMETPGGEATGAFEAAQAVRELAAKKHVVAVVNGMAASAGYALASGASKIVATPTGITGSIGVVLLHLDYSEALAEAGIKPTLIHAGAHKVDGNWLEPLSDSVAKDLQGEVDRFYALFLSTVAEGRGRRTPMTAARATEARTFIGKDAIDARLADDVGTFEEVLASLKTRAARSSGSSSSRRASKMADENDDLVLKADADKEKAAAFGRGKEEGKAEGLKEGEKAAYARLSSILAHDDVKGREIFALNLACDAPAMAVDTIAKHAKAAAPDKPEPAAPEPPKQQAASVADRAAQSTAEKVSAKPTGQEQTEQAGDGRPTIHQEGSGWNMAVKEVAARVESQQRTRRRA